MQSFVVFSVNMIWRLFLINLTFFSLSILGLGLLGIFPAFVASLWASARIRQLELKDLLLGMAGQYRSEFIRSNLLGLLCGGMVLFCGYFGLNSDGIVAVFALLATILAVSVLLAGLNGIAIMSGSFSDALYNCRHFFLRYSSRFVLIATAILPLLWVCHQQPLLGAYFGVSGFALINNWLVQSVIIRNLPNPSLLSMHSQEVRL
ncbi:DUF624 domain-containing protein [uncultured Cohaesibacter sp.]|uniref:DUF624 domain-containing protein n=1 Tax=uncultured Cohaesibacter sp. TaxID=1002546 RepID=UPI00292CF466|nr:DUF624 domain-containing protein [uncultured Cohaesibacter sp.]